MISINMDTKEHGHNSKPNTMTLIAIANRLLNVLLRERPFEDVVLREGNVVRLIVLIKFLTKFIFHFTLTIILQILLQLERDDLIEPSPHSKHTPINPAH